MDPASVYPCRRDPEYLRTTTGPAHGLAASDAMCVIARFTGLPLANAVGEYHSWSGKRRFSLLSPCVNTMD